ncbi:MAG: flippase activity-associated protein Agl23 [Anaerolineae bacterium]
MGRTLNRWERIVIIVILLLAVFTRFYILGRRGISHDESIHTKFSWNLYAGDGFQHNPMMHGPLLFEVTALSYHLLGVSDFTSRVFPALVGIALVMTPLLFRKWLGRWGSLSTSFLLLISPSISYYSRYIRHDVLLLLTAVLLLWVIMRYLETGRSGWLYWLAALFSLMYATKEASYIYTAIYGVLLVLPFAVQVLRAPWQRPSLSRPAILLLIGALVLGIVFVLSFGVAQVSEMSLDETGDSRVVAAALPVWGRVAALGALVMASGALVLGRYGIGEDAMRQIRLFDVLMVLGTLTLPLGSAFLIKFAAGVDMQQVYDAVRTGNFAAVPTETVVAIFAVTVVTLVVSIAFGLWWDRRRWPVIALIHYTIFIVLYTTIFTWAFGALSGLIGGLAYWLAQQGVKRGNQPRYYYLLIGPLYEYLALALSVGGGAAAAVPSISDWFGRERRISGSDEPQIPDLDLKRLFPLFLLGWTLMSWVAYTAAGEKMPWLLVHIVLPSTFLGGWGLGQLVARLRWRDLVTRPGRLFLIGLPLTLVGIGILAGGIGDLRSALSSGVSSAGFTLPQLWSIGRTLGGLLAVIAFGVALVWAVSRLGISRSLRLGAVLSVVALSALTVRTMAMLNYINYDLATEFLVYAHGTPDIKTALEQIRDVSWRVTGTSNLVKVAYGEDGSWPFTWYMVDYPNNYFYATSPDPEQLLACPVIIAGSPQYSVVEEILGDDYVHFDYLYLWWPIQDYYDLTWDRIRYALTDSEMRAALWQIVWDRDYRAYAELKNESDPFTLKTWPYRKGFRLYVRREMAQEIWPYSRPAGAARYVAPVATQPPDPYRAGHRLLPQISELLMPGAAVRGFDMAQDGTFYVADTANHRVWHVGPDGVLGSFGGFGAAPGQFSEPWDVAVDAEGNIYVADTWNHRIQKYSPDQELLKTWGELVQVTQTGVPGAEGLFFGPRGLAISPSGELYVADTGNKRIQVFDLEGRFLREFGGGGSGPGQLDEPVGIDISRSGIVAVADTWNQRVQLFTEQGTVLSHWDIPSWDVVNPDEKPFVAWGDNRLFATDPLRRRVLAFDAEGGFQWALSADAGAALSFPQGMLALDETLYVTDAHTGKLVGYELP